MNVHTFFSMRSNNMKVKFICGIFFLFLAAQRSLSAAKYSHQPHIVVIIADDLGRNDVSFHGSNQIPTPNIDSLAYHGVILKNYYVLPVCTPSRAAFLTGNYPLREGLQSRPLVPTDPQAIPLNVTLLPEYLQNLGYSTKIVGKWHLGFYAEEFLPANRGFDYFYGYYNGYMTYFTYLVEDFATHFSGYDLHKDYPGNYTTDYSPKKVYATDLFTNEVENVIARHDPEVPLYLQLCHIAPHATGRDNGVEVRNVDEVNERFSYIKNDSRRLYAGALNSLDDSVGRVMQALNEKGMLENSIIVFMSDNGAPLQFGVNYGSNYPYRNGKGSVWEGGVHAPGVIWSPLIKSSSQIHEGYFHIADWLPTLYRSAGGDVNDLGSIDGIDQWDAIVNGTSSPRDSLIVNIDDATNATGGIQGRYKYVSGSIDVGGFEYGENVNDGDLSAPPYNVLNVINSKTSQAIANATKKASVEPLKILELRRQATVRCNSPASNGPLNCTNGCLFDILEDPCETQNIVSQCPQVVERLEEFIDSYRSVLVPQPRMKTDLNALPTTKNGPWLPWLTIDGKLLRNQISFTSITLAN